MLHVARGALSALLLTFNTVAPGLSESKPPAIRMQTDGRAIVQRFVPAGARTGARPFVRTELYFGTARRGGMVTESEFRDFVDRQVTSRFPDGLTLLKGDGQFPTDANTIVKEQSFVVILLYPYDSLDEGFQRIELIRTLYKQEFDQESVLRVDHPFIVWVSF